MECKQTLDFPVLQPTKIEAHGLKLCPIFSSEVSSANSMLFHKIYTFYFHQLTEKWYFLKLNVHIEGNYIHSILSYSLQKFL